MEEGGGHGWREEVQGGGGGEWRRRRGVVEKSVTGERVRERNKFGGV